MKAVLLVLLVGALVHAAKIGDRPGFNVGLRRNGHDVIEDGEESPIWTNKTAPNYGYLIPPGTIAFDLYLTLNKSEIGKTPITQDFIIVPTSYSPGVFKITGAGWKGTVTTTSFLSAAHFDINCLKNKTARGAVEIFLTNPQYNRLDLFWTKQCMTPTLNVATPVGSGIANVVAGGQAVPGWTYTADVGETETTFAFWLPENDGIGKQQFFVYMGYNQNLMNAIEISQPNSAPARPLSAGAATTVTVIYNCHDYLATNSPSTFNLTIDVGWQNNIHLQYTKICGPPASGGGGGMNGASIFFLTVFVITTVFCVAGCAYNYTKRNLRGADMIPGIELFRACYNKMFGAPSYTPQTNYDNYDDSSSVGGKSYQTDL